MEIFSRYDDTTPVYCEDCGWKGQVRDCVHTYRGIPGTGGDVEPVDECPKCGSENLIDIESELAFV